MEVNKKDLEYCSLVLSSFLNFPVYNIPSFALLIEYQISQSNASKKTWNIVARFEALKSFMKLFTRHPIPKALAFSQ